VFVSNFNISLTTVDTHFNKYQGTGNDFIIIDNRDLLFISDPDVIVRMCHRRFGIGADGLILIEPHEDADFRMRYFNSDGYEGSMCGNGGRCAAHFAFNHKIAGNSMQFIAYDGVHRATVDGNVVHLTMSDVKQFRVTGDNCFLDTGSPHHVRFVSETENIDVVAEGRRIRYSDDYAPGGTNVNFVKIAENLLEVRTYERGVEDETLSCGTGVTASAIAAVLGRHFDRMPVTVATSGGTLTVSFMPGKEAITNVILSGPASFVFEGVFKI
jgi:diaminopimelate epimerase